DPPAVIAEVPRRPAVVGAPEYPFRFEVRPGAEAARVRLVRHAGRRGGGGKTWDVAGARSEIKEAPALGGGAETLELVAANAGARAGLEEFETTRLDPLVVVYNRKPTPPPTIALESVIGSDGEELKPGGGPVVVRVPRVRVKGRIEGQEALTLAERAV